MQDEQKKFQEKLSELLSYARDHENKVTMKEVRDFFEDFALDEQKVTFVCEYLTMEQVDVADYDPGVVPEETEKEKKKPEFSESQAAWTSVPALLPLCFLFLYRSFVFHTFSQK